MGFWDSFTDTVGSVWEMFEPWDVGGGPSAKTPTSDGQLSDPTLSDPSPTWSPDPEMRASPGPAEVPGTQMHPAEDALGGLPPHVRMGPHGPEERPEGQSPDGRLHPFFDEHPEMIDEGWETGPGGGLIPPEDMQPEPPDDGGGQEDLLGGLFDDLYEQMEQQNEFATTQAAQQLHQQELDRRHQKARVEEQKTQLEQRMEIMRPALERQMRRQMRERGRQASMRGHHGTISGRRDLMLSELAEDQAAEQASQEAQIAGQRRDLEHEMHGLEQRGLAEQAEALRQADIEGSSRTLEAINRAMSMLG